MTLKEDSRARYYLTSVFEGFGAAERVGEALYEAKVGVETIGDLLELTLPQIRRVMEEAHLSERDQRIFLKQMRASRLYPRGISNQVEFKLG